MMPIGDFITTIKDWAKKKDWKIIKISASKRREAHGLMDLGIGSWFRFIEKEWFEKAISEGIIIKNEYDLWVPLVDIENKQEAIGKKGRDTMYSTKGIKISSVSILKLKNFMDRYSQWKKQSYQVEADFTRLIDEYKKNTDEI